MIVAGIGCRKGATEAQVSAAVARALSEAGLIASEIGLLTTGEIKRDEVGIAAAARSLNILLMVIDDGRLRTAAARCPTQSSTSIAIAGVPSLSEAAALAGAGPGGRLLAPRIALDGVTCALAMTAPRGVAP